MFPFSWSWATNSSAMFKIRISPPSNYQSNPLIHLNNWYNNKNHLNKSPFTNWTSITYLSSTSPVMWPIHVPSVSITWANSYNSERNTSKSPMIPYCKVCPISGMPTKTPSTSWKTYRLLLKGSRLKSIAIWSNKFLKIFI